MMRVDDRIMRRYFFEREDVRAALAPAPPSDEVIEDRRMLCSPAVRGGIMRIGGERRQPVSRQARRERRTTASIIGRVAALQPVGNHHDGAPREQPA